MLAWQATKAAFARTHDYNGGASVPPGGFVALLQWDLRTWRPWRLTRGIDTVGRGVDDMGGAASYVIQEGQVPVA